MAQQQVEPETPARNLREEPVMPRKINVGQLVCYRPITGPLGRIEVGIVAAITANGNRAAVIPTKVLPEDVVDEWTELEPTDTSVAVKSHELMDWSDGVESGIIHGRRLAAAHHAQEQAAWDKLVQLAGLDAVALLGLRSAGQRAHAAGPQEVLAFLELVLSRADEDH